MMMMMMMQIRMRMLMCQGVKGRHVPAVERLITVSPSCQPCVIDVCYIDSSGQTQSMECNQDVVGVCGGTIRRISESSLTLHGWRRQVWHRGWEGPLYAV